MFKQILVAIDGSPTARKGLKTAIDLAADQKAGLCIVHVIDSVSVAPTLEAGYLPGRYFDDMIEALRDRGRRLLAKAQAQAVDRGVATRVVLVEAVGHAVADAILAQARKQRAQLIVLGTHGRRGLARALMGSDAESVVRDARVPVLLVRGLAASSRGAPAGKSRKRGASTVASGR
jgi:nucleotide-binding universal stress UspA family protein